MSDAAAFFAKKKKKKKAFKFNANKVDVTSVTSTVHVDAPALSTDQDAADKSGLSGAGAAMSLSAESSNLTGIDSNKSGEQWDDEAYSRTNKTAVTPSTATVGTTTELLDMKALDPKRNDQNNIAQKLRVEETKAQLAAAREGMEREAERIKKEREEQKQKETSVAPRFTAAAANVGGTASSSSSGKWVPPHLRGGGAGLGSGGSGMGGAGIGGGMGGIGDGLSRVRLGATQKVDTQDENLFPDLASASAIIEQQQKTQQPAFKAPKKTPVGGGASWASKTTTKSASKPAADATKRNGKVEPVKQAVSPAQKPAKQAASPAQKPEAPAVPAAEQAPAKASTAATTPSKPLVKKTKKKKKDLSTFKPS